MDALIFYGAGAIIAILVISIIIAIIIKIVKALIGKK